MKKSLVRKCRNELPSLRNSVHFDLDPYEWTHLQDLVNEKKTKLIEIITAVHRKKLLKLGVCLPKDAQDNNVTTRRNTKLVTSDAVHNKSNRELGNIETLVLEKGLHFGSYLNLSYLRLSYLNLTYLTHT